MSVPIAISVAAKLSKSEQDAFISLLSDEDSAVYCAVRAKILSFGPDVCAWLRPYALSSDPVLRRHVLEIIEHFERQHADTQFLSFCLRHGDEFDMEEGAWLLARTAYPGINVAGYKALLDDFAGELRGKLTAGIQPEDALLSLNRRLFDDLGFAGNAAHYYDPDNSYLNRVIDRRTGNPITLSLFYILLARRLQLPVVGIGLPGHFICRYQSSAHEVFIDVFNQGQLLTKADCIQYLQRGNYSLTEDFLAPATPRRMFMRICSNLHQIYTELGLAETTMRFQRYLVALAR